MPTNFPASLDTLTNPIATDKENVVSHAGQHANANDAIEAIQAKVGVGASTPTTGLPLTGTGVGASAWVALGNAGLGADVARLNALVNPGFEIWQRGTSFAGMANNAFACDMWQFSKGGTSALTVDRESSIIDTGSQYSAKLTYTHNTASTFRQKLEHVLQLRGRTVTFTVRVRANAATAVRLCITDSAGSTNGSYHAGNSAFATLSVTRTIDAAATSLHVEIKLDATVTAYVDNATVVTGTVASDFIPVHPEGDWARCQRYYQVVGGGAASQYFGLAGCTTTTAAWISIPLFVEMGGAPSVSVSSAGHFSIQPAGGSPATVTSFSLNQLSKHGLGIVVNVASGLTSGLPALLYDNTGTSSAKIFAEWNP